MTKRVAFLLAGTVLVSTVLAGLTEMVVPVDWNRFPGTAQPSPEFELSSRLVANAARHSQHWAEVTYETQAGRYLIKNENKEHTIRPATSAAYGLAVALCTGTVSGEEALEITLKLIRGAASIHKANGGKWGDHWQSSLWAAQLGRAAWMLWDELDMETREQVARLVVHEAGRNFRVRYWNGKGGIPRPRKIRGIQ
ncbi:hypothetical protein EGM51_17755 [Verrucomicrobia bacterium S94]|nr:hypothetical protein EGM51_17755 [Verrucomicrobia bacterium S94]